MTQQKSLGERVAALEARLVKNQPNEASDSSTHAERQRMTLAEEIDDLESRLSAMYMDEDIDELGMDDLDTDDIDMDDLDMDGMEPEGVEETTVIDETGDLGNMTPEPVDEDLDEIEECCDEPGMDMDEPETASDDRAASEKKPGIEDEITQDYLSEMEDVAHGEELATQPDTNAAARNTTPKSAAKEYVARLWSARQRLDRVANYLEKSGRRKLAFRIDKVSDSIDARIKKTRRA